MNLEPAAISQLKSLLCKIIKECEKEVNKKHGSKDKDENWCQKEQSYPALQTTCQNGEQKLINDTKPQTRAQRMGKEKHLCAAEKLNQINKIKGKNGTESKVSIDHEGCKNNFTRIPGDPGWINPDVIVGNSPNCDGVFDFKTSCPPGKEPGYGDPGFDPLGIYSSKKSKKYNKQLKRKVYRLICAKGVEPEVIHPETCEE